MPTAIKKIIVRSREAVAEVYKEAGLLAKLSHPSVIHYYNIWKELVPTSSLDAKTSSDDSGDELSLHESKSESSDDLACTSQGPLDFISSNHEPDIEITFCDDSEAVEDYNIDENEDDESEDDEEEDDDESGSGNHSKKGGNADSLPVSRQRRANLPYTTMIFISMEYCENHVSQSIMSSPSWRIPSDLLSQGGNSIAIVVTQDRSTQGSSACRLTAVGAPLQAQPSLLDIRER